MTGGIQTREIVVDNFAGGGGASTGIEAAIGRPIDIAINHDREAVAMHEANHPHTLHYCQSIWKADPIQVAAGRPVGLGWFSPDCKHFSKAKGGKPVEKHIRDLAWVVVDWARAVRPRVIMLENVEEFREWGPLITTEDGRQLPCQVRKGVTFKRWVSELQDLGYAVDFRELRASEYGVPTIRKRLFVIARRDGADIVFPTPSHGPGLTPYRTSAECIDWSIPCPSIFDRKRPLAEATMRRIARGLMRYVVNAKQPFIVPLTHAGDDRVHGVGEPLRTVTTAQRGEFALVTPYVVGTAHGEGAGRGHAEWPMHEPLRTVAASRDHALVSAHITKFRTGATGSGLDEPLPTVTANSYIKRPGGAPNMGLVSAFLAKHYGGHETDGWPLQLPISTITAADHHGVVAAMLSHAYTSNTAGGEGDPRKPMKTVTAGGSHHSLVAAFLTKYYGTDQDPRLELPLHTVTTKDRFGLVTVTIGGEPYVITDIGMRMLTPRELFRAQGFPDSYIIDPIFEGKPLTKTAQIRMCGNSVCPPVAEALVRANLTDMAEGIAA